MASEISLLASPVGYFIPRFRLIDTSDFGTPTGHRSVLPSFRRGNTPLGGSWYHIDFATPTVGFMGSNGASVSTTDGGATWRLVSGYPSCPVMYGMDFRDALLGLCGANVKSSTVSTRSSGVFVDGKAEARSLTENGPNADAQIETGYTIAIFAASVTARRRFVPPRC